MEHWAIRPNRGKMGNVVLTSEDHVRVSLGLQGADTARQGHGCVTSALQRSRIQALQGRGSRKGMIGTLGDRRRSPCILSGA